MLFVSPNVFHNYPAYFVYRKEVCNVIFEDSAGVLRARAALHLGSGQAAAADGPGSAPGERAPAHCAAAVMEDQELAID